MIMLSVIVQFLAVCLLSFFLTVGIATVFTMCSNWYKQHKLKSKDKWLQLHQEISANWPRPPLPEVPESRIPPRPGSVVPVRIVDGRINNITSTLFTESSLINMKNEVNKAMGIDKNLVAERSKVKPLTRKIRIPNV